MLNDWERDKFGLLVGLIITITIMGLFVEIKWISESEFMISLAVYFLAVVVCYLIPLVTSRVRREE